MPGCESVGPSNFSDSAVECLRDFRTLLFSCVLKGAHPGVVSESIKALAGDQANLDQPNIHIGCTEKNGTVQAFLYYVGDIGTSLSQSMFGTAVGSNEINVTKFDFGTSQGATEVYQFCDNSSPVTCPIAPTPATCSDTSVNATGNYLFGKLCEAFPQLTTTTTPLPDTTPPGQEDDNIPCPPIPNDWWKYVVGALAGAGAVGIIWLLTRRCNKDKEAAVDEEAPAEPDATTQIARLTEEKALLATAFEAYKQAPPVAAAITTPDTKEQEVQVAVAVLDQATQTGRHEPIAQPPQRTRKKNQLDFDMLYQTRGQSHVLSGANMGIPTKGEDSPVLCDIIFCSNRKTMEQSLMRYHDLQRAQDVHRASIHMCLTDNQKQVQLVYQFARLTEDDLGQKVKGKGNCGFYRPKAFLCPSDPLEAMINACKKNKVISSQDRAECRQTIPSGVSRSKKEEITNTRELELIATQAFYRDYSIELPADVRVKPRKKDHGATSSKQRKASVAFTDMNDILRGNSAPSTPEHKSNDSTNKVATASGHELLTKDKHDIAAAAAAASTDVLNDEEHSRSDESDREPKPLVVESAVSSATSTPHNGREETPSAGRESRV